MIIEKKSRINVSKLANEKHGINCHWLYRNNTMQFFFLILYNLFTIQYHHFTLFY